MKRRAKERELRRYPVLRDIDALRAHLDAAEASGEVRDFDVERMIAEEQAKLRG